MKRSSAVKSFAMTNMLIEADLDSIEKHYEIDLGRNDAKITAHESKYSAQFPANLRAEAKTMSNHYEVFYCLEKSIRQLVVDVLKNSGDEDWWDSYVPEQIKINVKKAIKRERESGVTPRSSNPIDYTNFGELSEIIKANWGIFGGTVFNEIKAVEKVMGSLNSLRNPIAHCSPLAEDEVLRLDISLRDWFRLSS